MIERTCRLLLVGSEGSRESIIQHIRRLLQISQTTLEDLNGRNSLGLQPNVHLGLIRVGNTVTAEVGLLLLHQNMSERVSKSVVLVSENESDGLVAGALLDLEKLVGRLGAVVVHGHGCVAVE